MSEENLDQYKKRIEELEQQLQEATQDNGFQEIKNKYETLIQEKDKTIQELEKTVDETNKKVDTTIQSLNNEVDEKLRQSEEYKQLVETVKRFEDERAEASVDTVIQKGLATPHQKNVLKKWCLNDHEGFTEYFDNAKPIIELDPKPHSMKVDTDVNKIVDFFKN